MDNQLISFHCPQQLSPKLSDQLSQEWVKLHELYQIGFGSICLEIKEWEVAIIDGNNYYSKGNPLII